MTCEAHSGRQRGEPDVLAPLTSGSRRSHNHGPARVGRWPPVTPRPPSICTCRPERGPEETPLSEVGLLLSAMWSRRLNAERNRFPFARPPQISQSVWERSLKARETASRCTVIGISVAESRRIQGTWPDSYSELLSSPPPPPPGPSVWAMPRAQTVTALRYSTFDGLYDCLSARELIFFLAFLL